ncbi:general secretion pathway protein GspB [Geoalkalibacter halelectricus]|uniref:general secretion pathway protein GspB n=1 Tax=Geoalkalibacter halelectricus TaxID=2847045 RepID=UPI003D256562
MSFILDALRKSDKKRPTGQVPDLQTDHLRAAPRSRRKASPLLVLLVVALLLNASLLTWWLLPRQTSPEEPQLAASGTEVAAPVEISPVLPLESPGAAAPVAVAGAQDESPSQAPALEPPEAPAVPATPAPQADFPLAELQAPSPQEVVAALAQPLPRLEELSRAQRAGFPDFSFSLHYYTAEPAQRLVRINGLLLREGQSLAEDLVLEEITPSGAVFDYQGMLFSVTRY